MYDGTQGWKLRPFLNRNDVEPFTADEARSAEVRDSWLVIAGQFAVIATVLLLWVGQDLSYSPGWAHPMAYYFILACGVIAVFGIAGLVLRRGSPRID